MLGICWAGSNGLAGSQDSELYSQDPLGHLSKRKCFLAWGPEAENGIL